MVWPMNDYAERTLRGWLRTAQMLRHAAITGSNYAASVNYALCEIRAGERLLNSMVTEVTR